MRSGHRQHLEARVWSAVGVGAQHFGGCPRPVVSVPLAALAKPPSSPDFGTESSAAHRHVILGVPPWPPQPEAWALARTASVGGLMGKLRHRSAFPSSFAAGDLNPPFPHNETAIVDWSGSAVAPHLLVILHARQLYQTTTPLQEERGAGAVSEMGSRAEPCARMLVPTPHPAPHKSRSCRRQRPPL